MEFTLLWAALTAFALAWIGLHLWPERVPPHALDRLVGAGVAGLLVGRVTSMIIQGTNPLTNLADFLIVRGGVHTGAASLAFLGALAWSSRAEPGALDAVAPATLLAIAGWHAGCVWRGACLGTASDLPWAWTLPGSSVSRHPVEIYVALLIAVGAWLVSRLGWRPLLRAGLALAVAAGARLLTEPMRPSLSGGPVGWYLAGVVGGILLAWAGPLLQRAVVDAPT